MAEIIDKHKHLDYIQATIQRLSNIQITIKGWSITLLSASLVFGGLTWRIALIACFVSICFFFLDAYYLAQERRFRHLYEHVRVLNRTDFTMNPDDLCHEMQCSNRKRSTTLSSLFSIANLSHWAAIIFSLTLTIVKLA